MLEYLITGSFPKYLGVQVLSKGRFTSFKVWAIKQGKSFKDIKGILSLLIILYFS